MATQKRVDGPTPSGGAYMVAYYLDEAGRPAEEQSASQVEVVEYDEFGEDVARTYASVRP